VLRERTCNVFVMFVRVNRWRWWCDVWCYTFGACAFLHQQWDKSSRI